MPARPFVLLLAAAAGCAPRTAEPASIDQSAAVSSPSAEEAKLAAVLEAALRFLEEQQGADTERPRLTLVASDELSPVELRVLARVRPFIRQRQVPTSPEEELPEDYLIVQGIEAQRDEGLFEGLLGPVPRNPPGKEDRILLACGTSYRLTLVRTAKSWVVRVITMGGC